MSAPKRQDLFILTLEAINAMRPFHHRSVEGSFRYEVVPGHTHKVLCAVAEILGCGNYVDVMIQELDLLFLGELVLEHGDQDLEHNCSLLCVFS